MHISLKRKTVWNTGIKPYTCISSINQRVIWYTVENPSHILSFSINIFPVHLLSFHNVLSLYLYAETNAQQNY